MKRSRIRPVSEKKQAELDEMSRIRAEFIYQFGYVCQNCGENFGQSAFRRSIMNLSRKDHHLPHTKNNCDWWCVVCHGNLRHGERYIL